jgi:cell shape-determining protein MreC
MPAYTIETHDTSGRRQVVVTAIFIVAALVVTYLPASGQQQVAAFLRGTLLRPFVSTQATITTARVRATETDALRQRLDSMVASMAAQGVLAEENRRLRGLLDLSRKLGPTFASATAVRAGAAGSESSFQVDVGAADGVRPNAPVISARGLVGVIRDVRADHSIGMDWTHPDFRAGAMTADGTTYGLVESRRGRFREEDRLAFNGTAFHTRLEEGTVIVTSGLGGVFPRGVPIGLVDGLAEAEGGWRKSYWLKALADPGTATHVLVAVGDPTGTPTDLTPIFPPDSVLTEQEFVLAEHARADSLRSMMDSLAYLNQLLAMYTTRDSARTAITARADSLARLRARTGQGQGTTRPAVPSPVVETPPRTFGGQGIRTPTIRPAVPPGGPPRVREDTTGFRRLPVPTDTIRLPPPEPPPFAGDTLQ